MGRPRSDAPSASWSKAWNQYVIRLSGEDIALGRESGSVLEDRRVAALADWYARGRQPQHLVQRADETIDSLILRYVKQLEARYENNQRDPKKELSMARLSFKLLRKRHGTESASQFDVIKLEEIRLAMSRQRRKWRGREVNVTKTWVDKCISYVRRLFKWAHRQRLIPRSVYTDLTTLQPLNASETAARINKPVEAVRDEHVQAIFPHIPPMLRTMILIQMMTGMRSGELCQMTLKMIDQSDVVWMYTPARRKTDCHGWNPPIAIPASLQSLLMPYLTGKGANEPIFDPWIAQAERNSTKRQTRVSKVQPSQQSRAKSIRQRPRAAEYTSTTYNRAVQYGIAAAIKAGDLITAEAWTPHQLRHNAARYYAQNETLTAAQTALGHKKIETTQRYVGFDERYAAQLALKHSARASALVSPSTDSKAIHLP